MPLIPTPACGPVTPADGCDLLWLIGEALREAGLDGLMPYLSEPGSPCFADLATFVGLASPESDFGDRFTVSLTSYGPSAAGNALLARLGDCSGQWVEHEAVWQVDLWAEGYPTVDREGDRVISVPDPAILSAVNQRLYVIGLAAYNNMEAAAIGGSIGFPGAVTRTSFTSMVPQRGGGQGGWRWSVTTSMA